jgi:hypothetical protein
LPIILENPPVPAIAVDPEIYVPLMSIICGVAVVVLPSILMNPPLNPA